MPHRALGYVDTHAVDRAVAPSEAEKMRQARLDVARRAVVGLEERLKTVRAQCAQAIERSEGYLAKARKELDKLEKELGVTQVS
jgi:SMC interacting uncharacterized protein involved in chromosome segregation